MLYSVCMNINARAVCIQQPHSSVEGTSSSPAVLEGPAQPQHGNSTPVCPFVVWVCGNIGHERPCINWMRKTLQVGRVNRLACVRALSLLQQHLGPRTRGVHC